MGRKAGLTVEDVVRAAAELADREGFEDFTLAGVAQRLGVRSPSLYAHVDGLPGLRRELSLRAAKELRELFERAGEGRRGSETVRQMATLYRRYALEHPGLYAAAQQAVQPGEDEELYKALLSAVGPISEALAEAGVHESDRIHVIRGIRSGLHGFVTSGAGRRIRAARGGGGELRAPGGAVDLRGRGGGGAASRRASTSRGLLGDREAMNRTWHATGGLRSTGLRGADQALSVACCT
jgi:AcrR family transcriptional regulator